MDVNELLYHRFKQHCASSNNGSETYFHNALKKYGPEQFVSTIVSIHTAESETDLVSILDEEETKSIFQLDTFNNGYNLTTGGSSSLFHETTRKKMSVKKQEFLATEDGRLWRESVRENKRIFFKTEKGKQNAKAHGVHISAKYKAEPELIERIRASVLSYSESPEGRERRSDHSEWMKTFFESPDGTAFKTHLSVCAKKRWENADYRITHIEEGKRRFQGADGILRKESLREKAVERMKDPGKRQLASEKTKAHFDRIGRKEYKCDLCEKEFRDKTGYARHCETKTHKEIASGTSKEEAACKVHEETSKKISEGNKLWAKTHENSRKGRTHTSEAKEKNRIAHLGKTLSESARAKLSDTIKNQYKEGARTSGLAKLTEEQVLYIRSNKGVIRQTDLAAQLKISSQTVSAVQRNLVYKHVDGNRTDTVIAS